MTKEDEAEKEEEEDDGGSIPLLLLLRLEWAMLRTAETIQGGRRGRRAWNWSEEEGEQADG